MNEPIHPARMAAIRDLADAPTRAEHDEYQAAIRDLRNEVARLTAEVITRDVILDLDATGEDTCTEEAAARALLASAGEGAFIVKLYRTFMQTITGIHLTDEQFATMRPIIVADQCRHVRAMIRVANKVREGVPVR